MDSADELDRELSKRGATAGPASRKKVCPLKRGATTLWLVG